MRLFTAVHDAFTPTSALYPGSFADIAASFVIDDVTYIDTDRRARQFFADTAGVDQLIAECRRQATTPRWRFIYDDYRSALPIADADVDLLISLYAGSVSLSAVRPTVAVFTPGTEPRAGSRHPTGTFPGGLHRGRVPRWG